jgi:hypothetical protein
MPIASRSGTRSATRRTWRVGDRPRSRLGPRSRPRPNPFAELAAGLESLIRFHQAHPDWFPPAVSGGGLQPSSPALSPEWEEAIRNAYHLGSGEIGDSPVTSGNPPAVSSSADGKDSRPVPSGATPDLNLTA